MDLLVDRWATTKHSTAGKLLINGQFKGYTLEDTYHKPKIHSETRIWDGTYPLRRRNVPGSRFDARYIEKLGAVYKGMFEICNVPEFDSTLLHTGNTHRDTEGCLLVGNTQSLGPDGDYVIGDSVNFFKTLYPILNLAWEAGEPIHITLKDRTPRP